MPTATCSPGWVRRSRREDRSICVRGTGSLHGIDADLSAVGELTPTIAALAALADSPSTLRGVGHLRGHETDRLKALATELTKLGARTLELEDGLEIHPGELTGTVFETYEDHRMATAAAIIGLRVPELRVINISTTQKTLPDFVGMWLSMLHTEPAADGDACAARPASTTSPTSGCGPTAAAPGLARRIVPSTRTRSRRAWCRWTAAAGAPVVAAGTPEERTVTAMRARELGRSPVVPHGDLVALVGDTSGRDGSLARIVRILERTSFLRRSADDDDSTERPLVANVDLMVMVSAVADPEPRGGMIDRCLVAAYVAGIDALLVLTKADLRSPEQFLHAYAPARARARGHPARGLRRDHRARGGARASRRAGQRSHRPLGRRQVHPHQCSGPGNGPRHRRGQRRHRARPAHLVVRTRDAAPRRRKLRKLLTAPKALKVLKALHGRKAPGAG